MAETAFVKVTPRGTNSMFARRAPQFLSFAVLTFAMLVVLGSPAGAVPQCVGASTASCVLRPTLVIIEGDVIVAAIELCEPTGSPFA